MKNTKTPKNTTTSGAINPYSDPYTWTGSDWTVNNSSWTNPPSHTWTTNTNTSINGQFNYDSTSIHYLDFNREFQIQTLEKLKKCITFYEDMTTQCPFSQLNIGDKAQHEAGDPALDHRKIVNQYDSVFGFSLRNTYWDALDIQKDLEKEATPITVSRCLETVSTLLMYLTVFQSSLTDQKKQQIEEFKQQYRKHQIYMKLTYNIDI